MPLHSSVCEQISQNIKTIVANKPALITTQISQNIKTIVANKPALITTHWPLQYLSTGNLIFSSFDYRLRAARGSGHQ